MDDPFAKEIHDIRSLGFYGTIIISVTSAYIKKYIGTNWLIRLNGMESFTGPSWSAVFEQVADYLKTEESHKLWDRIAAGA